MFKKVIIYILAAFLIGQSANAVTVLPWDFLFKLNVGLDYTKPRANGVEFATTNPITDIFKLKNGNAYAGLRILKYFGVEAGYTKIDKTTQNSAFTTQFSYLEGKLFYPLTEEVPFLSILPFSIDLYASYGQAKLSSSAVIDGIPENSNVSSANKYGYGAEVSLFNNLSARVGYYKLTKRIDVLDDRKLGAYYGGISYYFF